MKTLSRLLQKLFGSLKEPAFVPTKQFLIELPGSDRVFTSAQNKELTDIQYFYDLLSYFNHFPYKEENALQSINQNILSFKKNIYEVSSWMSSIVRNVTSNNTEAVNFIRRVGLEKRITYVFFNEKPSDDFETMDQKTIDQLVGWMKTLLDYFEEHKTCIEDGNEAQVQICLAIYSKLNLFYDFYYYLLCHMADVRCDNLSSIAKIKAIEI